MPSYFYGAEDAVAKEPQYQAFLNQCYFLNFTKNIGKLENNIS